MAARSRCGCALERPARPAAASRLGPAPLGNRRAAAFMAGGPLLPGNSGHLVRPPPGAVRFDGGYITRSLAESIAACAGAPLADFGPVPREYAGTAGDDPLWTGAPIAFEQGMMYVVLGTYDSFDLLVLREEPDTAVWPFDERFCGYRLLARVTGGSSGKDYACAVAGTKVRVWERWSLTVARSLTEVIGPAPIFTANMPMQLLIDNARPMRGRAVLVEGMVSVRASPIFDGSPLGGFFSWNRPTQGISFQSTTCGGVGGAVSGLMHSGLEEAAKSLPVERLDNDPRFTTTRSVDVAHLLAILSHSSFWEGGDDWLTSLTCRFAIACGPRNPEDPKTPFPDDTPSDKVP